MLRCESDGRDDQHVEHKVDIGLVEHRELILRVGDTLLPEGKVVKHVEQAVVDKDDHKWRDQGADEWAPTPERVGVFVKLGVDI